MERWRLVRGLGLHVNGFPVGKGFVRCTLDLDRNGMDHAVDAFGIGMHTISPIARKCTSGGINVYGFIPR